MRGFLPLREGGFTRSPGTLFRGHTRGNKRARLINFEFAANDALTLEFTDGYMRVWRYGALVMSGAAPYELATPYDEAAIQRLQWVQSADVIYLADGQSQINKLSRFALDNWTIAPVTYERGPFRIQNLDEAKTIQCSATTGSVTLTGVGNIFDATFVGVLLRLVPVDFTNIALWTSNTAVSVGDLMRNGNEIYELTAGSNTGAVAPVHKEGTQLVDKSTGTKWKHVSGNSGIVRITAVSGPNSATADVLKAVPKACVDSPTYRWSEGAWSQRHGFPKALAIHEQRLWAGFTANDPRTVWASTIGDFEDFEPSVQSDGSFAYKISGSDTQNGGNWLRTGRRGIYIGALGEVYRGFSNERGQPLGPTTFSTELEATDGTTSARPILPYGFPVYPTKDETRLVELRYSFQEDGARPVELSSPSSHLGVDGFVEVAWQSSPHRLAWLRRNTGDLLVMLYDPKEDVLGWAVYPLAGGFVESMSITPEASGGKDILTLSVKRVINGATVRMIEEQALIYGTLFGADPISSAVHFFAASKFAPGVATDTFNVVHLLGQDVHIWTDKGEFGPMTVPPGGDITLPVKVNSAVIGLFDATHKVETLPIRAAASDGDPRGRPMRLHSGMGLILHRTAAGHVAAVERDLAQPDRVGKLQPVLSQHVAADLTQAFSGTTQLSLPSGYAAETSLEFRPCSGAPMTVLAVIPPIEEAGA